MTERPSFPPVSSTSAPTAGDPGSAPAATRERQRILALVRTGLTLAVGYLLVFSAAPALPPPGLIAFAVAYIASNLAILYLPARWLGWVAFDAALVLVDTAAISCALLLIPHSGVDIFVFYFTIILLASVSDRRWLNVGAPIVTTGAYVAFLLARHGAAEILQPAILLRLPFLLLTGAFYGFFVDRVRRREQALADARQRAHARTELLATITHDLKQPLWLATQAAAVLYDELPDDAAPARERAAQVILSLKRMEALTLNFLELSEMETHGPRVFVRRVPLERILRDLVEVYRPAFELKGLRVRLAVAPVLPAAWIDPLQTERCLANLLDNAIKYTPAGGVVTVDATVDGSELLVVVGDSGPGIAAERRATLFTRFQTGTDTEDRRSTGLGLYIAHAIAEAMGGELTLDPSQTEGAWFRLRLPIAARPALVAAPAPATACAPLQQLSA